MDTRTLPAAEAQGFEVDQVVDLNRPKLQKDLPEWSGPATVADLTQQTHGVIGLR